MTIQEMINDSKAGDHIQVPPGVYIVDGATAPLRPKSGIILDLTNGVTIQQAQTNVGGYQTVQVWAVDDVTVLGGVIIGDGLASGAGMCVQIGGGSHNINFTGTQATKAQADGFEIVDATGVILNTIGSYGNRRSGISVTGVNGFQLLGSHIQANGPNAPGAGLDLESESGVPIQNALISHNMFGGNTGPGVLVATPPALRHNISITDDNIFVGKPIDGTDGIVPFWAKWLGQAFGYAPSYPWYGYPRALYIP